MPELHALLRAGDQNVKRVPCPPHLNPPKILVLTMDARLLADNRETLSTYHKSLDAVFSSGCIQIPDKTITLFLMMMACAEKPSLTREPLGDDVPAAAIRASDEQSFHAEGEEGVVYSRVDLYHETIFSEEGLIVAHRFVWVILDTGFNINLGIENLIADNRKREATRQKRIDQGQVHFSCTGVLTNRPNSASGRTADPLLEK